MTEINDKTRHTFAVLSNIVSFITIIAIGCKLLGWIDWSWFAISSVYLITNVIGLIMLAIILVATRFQPGVRTEKLAYVKAIFIGMSLWISSMIMIVSKLDGYIDWSWWIVCGPLIAQSVFFIVGMYIIIANSLRK